MSSDDEGYTPKTVPFDPRFPNTNQTFACFVNYVDYHRCMDLLEGDARCDVLKKMFTTICPYEWVSHWDELREKGNFPARIPKVPKDYCEKLKDSRDKCKK